MAKITAQKANYDKICVECVYIERKQDAMRHLCSRPVNLITGAANPVRCFMARLSDGHCGPHGKNYVSSNIKILVAAE